MKYRQKFEIRGALIIWNIVLAVFSTMGALRLVPELLHVWHYHGQEAIFCKFATYYKPPTFVWAFLFALSKIVELGDTVFIVLRKQPLIFLHWYHHITVMVYVWYGTAYLVAPARPFIAMNFCVHSLMYTYYALKAMRMYVPRWVSMVLTTLQISQMVVGIVVNVQAYNVFQKGQPCQQSKSNLICSLLMYASYFVLFVKYFYNAYMTPKRRTKVGEKRDQAKLSNGVTKMADGQTNGFHEYENSVVNGYKVKSH